MTDIQSDLDRAYSPSVWSHRISDPEKVIESHLQTISQATEHAQKTIPCLLNWPIEPNTLLSDYGIDLYLPWFSDGELLNLDSIKPKAIFVYIHGGYWQFLSRKENGFMAQTMSDEQIVTAVIGYPIAPHATMEQIISCVEHGLVKIVKWAMKLSVKVFVAGHSAGAHLAATTLLIDWERKYNIPCEIFGGFFLISGVFDLIPLVSTYVNKQIGMTIDTAKHSSPIWRAGDEYNKDIKDVIVLCVHAEHDPPCFHEQNQNYASYLEKIGFTKIKMIRLDHFDHFDVIEQLENRDQPLTLLILNLIKESI